MISSGRRYVSAAVLPGRATDSSASATNGAWASASENTATVAMSSDRAERITREAISPRLAMSSFLIRFTCVIPVRLHPEDAEAAASLDPVRMGARQADGQHSAGIGLSPAHSQVIEGRCGFG